MPCKSKLTNFTWNCVDDWPLQETETNWSKTGNRKFTQNYWGCPQFAYKVEVRKNNTVLVPGKDHIQDFFYVLANLHLNQSQKTVIEKKSKKAGKVRWCDTYRWGDQIDVCLGVSSPIKTFSFKYLKYNLHRCWTSNWVILLHIKLEIKILKGITLV